MNPHTHSSERKPTLVVVPVQPQQPGILDSRQLFQGGKTVHIDHGGQRYVLRLTRENKLLLTK